MDRSVLQLREYTPSTGVELTPVERDDLTAIVPDIRIAPTPGFTDRYDLWPTATIGVARFGQRTVEIKPRLPLDRVLFLASYAIGNLRWPHGPVGIDTAPDLVEAVSRLFVRLAEPALARGILQGYRRVDDRLQTIRGRIRFADQISRWNGQAPPIEVSYDDYTVDILENQLLKAAAHRLSAIGHRDPKTAESLRRVSFLLADVEDKPFGGREVPEVAWTRLNDHYRPPVELARLILRGTGLESAAGPVSSPSFLLNMATVFERFVQRALRESLRLTERAFPDNAGARRLRMDDADRIVLRPDLSWWEGPTCIFVGDCKYKRTDNAIQHADLYQLLAYATATDLPGGLLIYAAGEAEPTDHVVRNAGKHLRVRTLDLAGTPPEILRQIGELAQVVRRLAKDSETGADGRASRSALMSQAWRIRAWDDTNVEQDFVRLGLVGVSNDEVIVYDDPPPEVLRRRIQAAHPGRTPKAVDTFVRYWRNFLNDMQPDDVVAVPMSDRRVAIGVVLGEAGWSRDLPTWARNHRPVEWVNPGMSRDQLPEDLAKTVNAMGTICRFNADSAADRLLACALGSGATRVQRT